MTQKNFSTDFSKLPKISFYLNTIQNRQSKSIPANSIINILLLTYQIYLVWKLGQANGLLPLITNIHSYCALFLRQHGGPSVPFRLNQVAGVWHCCQYLQQHRHVSSSQNSLVKGNMLHIEFNTRTVANTHRQTITNHTSDTEAQLIFQVF